jgi:ABC-type glycerol-3-phosphate transport system substrate-binding protein
MLTRRQFAYTTIPLPGVLAACARQQPGATQQAQQAASRPPVKIVWLLYQSRPPRMDLQVALAEDFNKQHPHIQIEPIAPDIALVEKATVFQAAGNPVDFFEWPRLWREVEELIIDQAPFFKRDKVDLKNLFLDTAIAPFLQGDHIWGHPISISVDAVAYNIDMFDAVGLKYPPVNPEDKSWTMETFQEYAIKLTDRSKNQYGWGGGFSGGHNWMVAGNFFGTCPWDPNTKRSHFNSPQYRQAVQYWADLRNKHRVNPTSQEAQALTGGQNINIFATGKIGMQVVFNIADKVPARWGLATLPYSGAGRNISGRISVHALFLGRGKNPDAAWEVFKWFTKPENAGRYVISDGHAVSPIKGGSDLAQKDFMDRMGVDARAYLLQAQTTPENGCFFYLNKQWPDFDREIGPKWNETMAGNLAPAEFAAQAYDAAKRILGHS